MTKEYPYHKGSWQYVITEIKEHLGMSCLTPELAKTILALYIKGVGVTEIINVMEGAE